MPDKLIECPDIFCAKHNYGDQPCPVSSVDWQVIYQQMPHYAKEFIEVDTESNVDELKFIFPEGFVKRMRFAVDDIHPEKGDVVYIDGFRYKVDHYEYVYVNDTLVEVMVFLTEFLG